MLRELVSSYRFDAEVKVFTCTMCNDGIKNVLKRSPDALLKSYSRCGRPGGFLLLKISLAGKRLKQANEGNKLGGITLSLFYTTLRAGLLTDRYIYSLMARGSCVA